MIPENGLEKFYKIVSGRLCRIHIPSMLNSQEFALYEGVIFDTLANNNESRADGVFI